MRTPEDPVDLDAVVSALRDARVRFAYLHGSQADGTAGERSDVDVAVWFGVPAGQRPRMGGRLPGCVDLLVLDEAPLELSGRVALGGRLLFDDDPPARVQWEATTRKIYADERPRTDLARADFAKAWARGRS